MALFGNLDGWVISPLTTFYQVEVDLDNLIGGELDIWMYRNTGGSYDMKTSWVGFWQKYEKEATEILLQMASIHALLVRVMDKAAALSMEEQQINIQKATRHENEAYLNSARWFVLHNTPSLDYLGADDVDALNQVLRDVFRPPQMMSDPENGGQSGIWNRPLDWHILEREKIDMLHALLTDFIYSFNGKAFRICEVCGCVYGAVRSNGATHETKRYCSNRCSNRARQRRRKIKTQNQDINGQIDKRPLVGVE